MFHEFHSKFKWLLLIHTDFHNREDEHKINESIVHIRNNFVTTQ